MQLLRFIMADFCFHSKLYRVKKAHIEYKPEK